MLRIACSFLTQKTCYSKQIKRVHRAEQPWGALCAKADNLHVPTGYGFRARASEAENQPF